MTKWIFIGAGLLILALDWVALHDILKGRETDFASEWTMVVLSIPLLILLFWLARDHENTKGKNTG